MNKSKILNLAQTAILTAIVIILAFTPLGYFKSGPLSISFLTIPVIIAAVLLPPLYSCFVGFAFGVTSFVQCFGMDPFGTALFQISPVYTFITCIIVRIIIPIFACLVYRGLKKVKCNDWISLPLASLTGALTNTVLFLGCIVLFFGSDVVKVLSQLGVEVENKLIPILLALGIVNGLIEAATAVVITPLIIKPLKRAIKL